MCRDLSDVPLGDHVPPQSGCGGPFFNSSGALASVHWGVRFSPLSEFLNFPSREKKKGNTNRWEMGRKAVKLRSTDADWEKGKSRSDPADTELRKASVNHGWGSGEEMVIIEQ